jgi:hypothetical protein
MAGCSFEVIDRGTRKTRPCRMPCGIDTICRVHLPRKEVAELRLEVKQLGEKLCTFEALLAKLQEEVRKRPGVGPAPPVAPPPPPPPPRRTTSLPILDPIAALFESPDGRALATIMRSKAPFSTYTDAGKLLREEAGRIAWAVRTLKAMHAALIEHGNPVSSRTAEIRRFFCSDRIRVGHEVLAEDIAKWVQSLTFSKSQDDLQAELRSALARRKSLGHGECV